MDLEVLLLQCREEQREAAAYQPRHPGIELWMSDWIWEEMLILKEMKEKDESLYRKYTAPDTKESLRGTEGVSDRTTGHRENNLAKNASQGSGD